jgi:hypothetical protein
MLFAPIRIPRTVTNSRRPPGVSSEATISLPSDQIPTFPRGGLAVRDPSGTTRSPNSRASSTDVGPVSPRLIALRIGHIFRVRVR